MSKQKYMETQTIIFHYTKFTDLLSLEPCFPNVIRHQKAKS